MARYLLTRLGQGAITLVLASIVVFAGVRALPGDPALALAGEDHSQKALAAIKTGKVEAAGHTYIPVNPGWDLVVSNLSEIPVTAACLGPVAGLGAANEKTEKLSSLVFPFFFRTGLTDSIFAKVPRSPVFEVIIRSHSLPTRSSPEMFSPLVICRPISASTT